MTDCTVTLAVNRPGAALFVVQPEARRGQHPCLGRIVRARARSFGYATASFAPGARESPLRPVAGSISSFPTSWPAPKRSLLHAFGGVRPGRADSPAVKFHLNQVTARVKGGLVHLDSTPEEPELPFATILAENSILSTANRDDPLFRLDGRDQLDDLGNKIRWEGRRVAYDRIKTYRRDEVVKTGVSPRIYDRA